MTHGTTNDDHDVIHNNDDFKCNIVIIVMKIAVMFATSIIITADDGGDKTQLKIDYDTTSDDDLDKYQTVSK